MKFLVIFKGRKIGAIGAFTVHELQVEADGYEQAVERCYETHEHIHVEAITPLTLAPIRNYEVVVGNIGRVWNGTDEARACACFDDYREQSRRGIGRAAGESVILFADGEPIAEHDGVP